MAGGLSACTLSAATVAPGAVGPGEAGPHHRRGRSPLRRSRRVGDDVAGDDDAVGDRHQRGRDRIALGIAEHDAARRHRRGRRQRRAASPASRRRSPASFCCAARNAGSPIGRIVAARIGPPAARAPSQTGGSSSNRTQRGIVERREDRRARPAASPGRPAAGCGRGTRQSRQECAARRSCRRQDRGSAPSWRAWCSRWRRGGPSRHRTRPRCRARP